MRISQSQRVLCALPFLLAAPLLGQDADESEATPSLEQRMPSFALAQFGEEAWVKDGAGRRIGTFVDHVIDRESGQAKFAIVDIGTDEVASPDGEKHTVLVPFERFVWSADDGILVLPLSPDELMGMTPFDPDGLQEIGAAAEDASAEASETEQEAEPVLPKNLLASEITGARAIGGSEPYGWIGSLVLEERSGTIAFALIHERAIPNEGEDALVVPWGAMAMDLEGQFALTKSAEELGGAPLLEHGSLDALKDAKARAEIYRFYGLEVPEYSEPVELLQKS